MPRSLSLLFALVVVLLVSFLRKYCKKGALGCIHRRFGSRLFRAGNAPFLPRRNCSSYGHLWWKAQHSNSSPGSTRAAKLRHRKHQQETKHTHSTQDRSAAEEPSREQRRNKWYTSEENEKIKKAHRQDNLSPAEIGKEVGRSAKGIEHRLRGLQRNNASSHASSPTDRAPLAQSRLSQRIDRSDDSSDESTFEVVSRNSSAMQGSRGRSARADHAATTASTTAVATATAPTSSITRVSVSVSAASSATQWFEDGRFSNAPYDRRADVEEGGDRKRRKRAADFMQDAFQCDTFDAGIDSYSDMDYD